jgi:hypothetical protein
MLAPAILAAGRRRDGEGDIVVGQLRPSIAIRCHYITVTRDARAPNPQRLHSRTGAVSDRAFVVRWHLSSIAAANRDLPMAASPDSRTTWSSPLLALDQRRNRNSSSSSRPTSCVRLLECRASKRLSTDDGLTAAQALTGPEIPFRSCAPVKGLLRRVFATAPASDAKSLGFLSCRLWRPPTSVFASLAVLRSGEVVGLHRRCA